MASSSYEVGSSSSTSAPRYTGEWEHDVFVCFRGKDTRGIFTSHLAGQLDEKGIRVFTDDKLKRTEDIGELLSILARSAISVVIFSENFADSSWCLDEVATIAERMEHFGHRVLPVFYRVNPDDVSDDSGTYASIIDIMHKPNLEQKKRWMDALKAVAKRAGRTSNENTDDYELYKMIMGDVLEILTGMSSSGKSSNFFLVGMDTRMLKVQQLLAMDDDTSNDARAIGFWGMGGLGKTTLATALYHMLTSPTKSIKHHFVNVKAGEVEEQVLEMYSTLLSQNNLRLIDLDVDHRRERLSRLKVVVVLDNVDTTVQLEKLLLGHEVIIVHDLLKEMAWNIVKAEPVPSRLQNPVDVCKLFAIAASKKCGCKIFKTKYRHMKNVFEGGKTIQSLDLDILKARNELCLGAKAFEGMDSLRLLSIYGGANLVPDKLRLVDGRLDTLPNELRVLHWIGFPSKCLPAKFDPEKLVKLVLSHSRIERCWEGVQNLVHLITLDLSHCLNLRAIPNLSVCKQLENLLLKGCKRLVELPPCVQYLDKLVELDLSDCPNLKRLPPKLNSKFLEYFYMSNCPNVTFCPEINSSEGLQVLDLEETPVRELPSAIHKVKEGGTLRLCGKHISSFPRISTSLKLFRLCHSMITKMDVRDDDCSSSELLLPKFDQLELVENYQLVSLSNSIWDVVKYKLEVESPLIESLPDISYPINDLTDVQIINCWNLKSFPSGINHLRSVLSILFIGTSIKSLPSSIHLLDNLRHLILFGNFSLESIPDNIHQLAKLELLDLHICTKIRYLPQLLPPELKDLDLSRCKSLQALPTNIGKLNLRRLEFDNCPQLDYKLADKIAAYFHSRAMMSQLDVKSNVKYSGSELPQWCSSNGSGANCEIELPPPSANNELATGIAFGVVFSLDPTEVVLKMECDIVTECTTVATFSSSLFWIENESDVASSDYVYLWFDNKLSSETKKAMEDEEVPWYVKYAGCTLSFRAQAVPSSEEFVEEAKKIKLKRFGVSLLY
ncbi:Disease resistance-like protein DSC1 [Linum perenne]